MPEKRTLERARKAKGDEIRHVRHGKHGARSTKQAIAIGREISASLNAHSGHDERRFRAS